MSRRLLPVLLLLMPALTAWANCTIISGNAARTPDADLTNGTNQITHTKTNLIWKECVEGLSGDNACTTGTAGTFTWQQALQQAVTAGAGWRLPSRNELLSIVETGCSSNMINTTRFPNSPPSGTFWTSTPLDEGYPTAAWAVRFGDGTAEAKEKSSLNYVRLVSSGTADETFNSASAPVGGPSSYSFTANTTALPSTQTTSNAVTLSGITGSVPISISGGEYMISRTVTFTNATETVNRTGHGLAFGDTVQFTTSGVLPTGLSAATNYYVTGRNSIGSTITFTDTGDIINWTAHGLPAGAQIEFTNSGGALPTSLTAGTNYYVRSAGLTANAFTVSTTAGTGGAIRTFTGAGTGTHTVWTNQILADSFSIAANSGDVTGLTFTTDGTGTHYLVASGLGVWRSDAGTVANGDQLQVRLTAAGAGGTTRTATVNINGVSAGFAVTTAGPSPIVFTPRTGMDTSSEVTSDAPILSGITGSVNITALSGTGTSLAVLKNGTPYTAANLPLAVSSGDTIALRQTTSASVSTATTAIVTINGQSFTFTATTAAGGVEPDDFSFTPKYEARRASTITSDTVQIHGLTAERAVTVGGTGAAYKIGKPVTFSNASDLVNMTAHQLLVGTELTFTNVDGALPTGLVRGTKYYVISANRTNDVFQVSTTPGGAAVNFTSDGSGSHFVEEMGVPVTFTNGTPDLVNLTAHGLPAGAIVEFSNVGGALPTGLSAATPYYVITANNTANSFQVSGTGTTGGTGSAFSITSTGTGTHYMVRKGTVITGVNSTTDIFTTTAAHGLSAGAKVKFRAGSGLPTGITAGTLFYVIAGNLTATTFQVSATPGGAAVDMTTTGTAPNYVERFLNLVSNDALTVSGTSSSSNNTLATVTATINARSFPFDFTTGTEPAVFYFDEIYGQALSQGTCGTNASCAAGDATLSGIGSGTSNNFSIAYSSGTTGAVNINGAGWVTSAPASFTGTGSDTLSVRVSTPNCNYSQAWADVTINGLTSRLQTWTGGGLTGPTGMANFISTTNQALNSVIEAPNYQTVSGLQVSPSCIRIEGGEYKIGSGGSWTSSSGTVANASAVYVRLTSSGMPNVTNTATLYINGAPFSYSVTTGTNISFFTLTPASAVTTSSIEESLPVTLDYTDAVVGPVTFTNGTDRVNLAGHGLTAGNPLRFTNSGGALPAGAPGVVATTNYYVINPTANDFQISTTAGGAAVNFTSDGTGTTNGLRLRTASISISGSFGTNAGIDVFTNGAWSGSFATSKLVGPGDQLKARLTTASTGSVTSSAALIINGQGFSYAVTAP